MTVWGASSADAVFRSKEEQLSHAVVVRRASMFSMAKDPRSSMFPHGKSPRFQLDDFQIFVFSPPPVIPPQQAETNVR